MVALSSLTYHEHFGREMAEVTDAEGADGKADGGKSPRRIPGNLTYITNHGTVKTVLEKIITASKPDKFSQDYLATVLGMSGGGARAVIPILKRVGFLTSDGTPTELYSKFRTDSGRPEAALGALRAGFAELFRRNEHIYAATEAKLTDAIVEITGLKKDDPVVRAIRGTFQVFRKYLPPGFTSADVGKYSAQESPASENEIEVEKVIQRHQKVDDGIPFGLSYQINIVLPETKDIEVYNSIFRSLRDNLLRI